MEKQTIIEMRKQGYSYGAIAKEAGLSRARIHQICSEIEDPKTKKAIKLAVLERDKYRLPIKAKTRSTKKESKKLT